MAKVAQCHKTGETFNEEYKMLRRDGQTISVHDHAQIVKDAQGSPLFLLGIKCDITTKKQTEQSLRERERELEIQTKNLEEMNAALSVLLKKREADKTELEEKVLFNINQLIEPYIAKLNQSGLDERQKALAIIIESNLKEITSSFAFTLSTPHLNMTPKEIEVANLIKQGKATKEICEILGSSEKVIAFHRQNIRKKLGLLNKKVNLKSYLISKLK
jgi:DNA-binding CsgD family transcriptional regulator